MDPADFAAEMRRRESQPLAVNSLLRASLPIIQADEQTRFETDTAPDSSEWPEHAPSTVRRYGVHPILEMTGALRAAATGPSEGNIARMEGDTLTYGIDESVDIPGSGIPFASVHQMGSRDGRIPARPFLGLSDAAEDELAEMAAGAEERTWR